MVVLVVVKRGLPPSSGGTSSKLLTTIWIGQAGFTSLDLMGVLTHPRQMSRRLRHCSDVEKLVEWKVPMKVGELTKPMVDVISKTVANCLDPDGNIDKELRPVSSIR